MGSLLPIWQNVYLRAIVIVLAFLVILYLLRETRFVWQSFLIAFLVGYLTNPALRWLERRRIPRPVGVVLIMLLIVFAVLVAMLLLSSILIDLAQIPVELGRAFAQIPTWFQERAPGWLQDFVNQNQAGLIQFWTQVQTNFTTWLQTNAERLVSTFIQGTQGVFQSTFNLFILFVFIAFMVSGYPVIQRSLFELFPQRHRPFAREIGDKLDTAVGGYLRAKVIESSTMFVVTWTALSLIGVPNAAALGLINALLNPVPYIGSLIATVIETLMALTVSWQLALITLIVVAVIEQLDGNVLGPLLLSRGVKVHPVTVLAAVLTGGALLGIWGVLLAVPSAAFLTLLYRDYYQGSSWYVRSAGDDPAGEA